MRYKFYLKKLLMPIIFLAGLVILVKWTPVGEWLQPDFIRPLIEPYKHNIWAAWAFFFLSIIGYIVIAPATGLCMLGGAVFDYWQALMINIGAIIIGSSACYFISKGLAEDFVKKMVGSDKISVWKSWLGDHGGHLMIAMRIVPIFPLSLLNYGAPLAQMKFRDFIFGTSIGILAPIAFWTYLGRAIIIGRNSWIEAGICLFGIIALVWSVGVIWKRRAKRG
ncbi:MAG: phospholipase D1/2 [Candidatus Omnitrophota bacterium]|jgi:phospholipase D1/2